VKKGFLILPSFFLFDLNFVFLSFDLAQKALTSEGIWDSEVVLLNLRVLPVLPNLQ
jgi:hypothetical protein